MISPLIWYFRMVAVCSQALGRPDAALNNWKKILSINPADAKTLMSMALLKSELNDRPGALALTAQALRSAPGNASFWFNQGFLQQEQDEHASALQSFDHALVLDPKLDRAWYGKALSLIKLHKLDEAVAALLRNTELQPMSPYGWYQLAHLYHRLGQTDSVKKVIRKLSGFEPNVALQLQRETGVDIGFKSPLGQAMAR
jgi:tetratricopeptide (TPR) repeat protein